jgi:ATP-dependent HslUV protease ATP-binding subunit HslU
VKQLDQHIVSQDKAKRVIAQAVRNKYRMRQIESDIRKSMRPSNILVHGKSGSGKTEIFRKISQIYNAPFIHVEATKYTEVGYHGDDITNIIKDLFKKTQTELAQREGEEILSGSKILKEIVDSLLLKYIIGPSATENPHYLQKYEELQEGLLEEYSCFIYQPGDKKYTQQIVNLKVKDIRKHVYNTYLEEIFAQIDLENYVKDEIESKGIVIIDEIDKLVRAPNSSSSTKASDEGVQYDMLPLLDGTTVTIN